MKFTILFMCLAGVASHMYDSTEIISASASSEEKPAHSSEELVTSAPEGVVTGRTRTAGIGLRAGECNCNLSYHAKAVIREKCLQCLTFQRAFYITRNGWICGHPNGTPEDFKIMHAVCNYFQCFAALYWEYNEPEYNIRQCTAEELRPNMWER